MLTLCFKKITGASSSPEPRHSFAKPCSMYLQLPQEVRKKSTTTRELVSFAFSRILKNSSSVLNSLTHSTGQRSSSSSESSPWFSYAALLFTGLIQVPPLSTHSLTRVLPGIGLENVEEALDLSCLLEFVLKLSNALEWKVLCLCMATFKIDDSPKVIFGTKN